MKSASVRLLQTCFAALLALSAVNAAFAQTAQDNAANAAYATSWGTGTNGGTGFGPWQLFSNNNPGSNDFAGFYIGSSGVGAVDVASKSFGIYANGANYNYAIAFRPLGAPLTTDKVFSFKFKNNSIATGKQVGFSLFNGTSFTQTNDFNTLAGAARFNFYFLGGNATYSIWDGDGPLLLADVPYRGDGLTVEFTLRSANTYSLTIKSADGATIISSSVVDYNLQGSGNIDSFACYVLDNDTGNNGDLQVNQFSVVPTSLIPPVIQNVRPANGSVYVPTTTNIVFDVLSPFSGIASNGAVVTLNGVAVTNFFVAGPSTNRTFTTLTTLALNTVYDTRIVVTDINGNRATNTFTFNTWSPTGFFIEAEDYNYNRGGFIPSPTITQYRNITLPASNNVDFLEYGDPTNNTGFANNYRSQDPIWLELSGDSVDHANYQPFGVDNYAMGFINNGEWLNYTRRITNGAYAVYARMSGNGPSPVMLMERAASATVTNAVQPRIALGTFVGVNTGNISSNYTFVQLKDFFSQPVTLRFSTNAPTTNTFRLTNIGNDGYNFDYLIFVPLPVANTNTQRPYLTAGFPFPGATGVLPDEPITFSIANRDTTNVPALTKLFVNGAQVSLTFSNHAAGSTFTSQPATLYPVNTNVTVRVIQTDSAGVNQTNDWQFGVANILTIPSAYALTTGSGVNPGFNLRVAKYPDVWPGTATPAPGSSAWAEAMLAGTVVNATAVSSGNFTETNVINYELCGNASPDGNTFLNNAPFPGIALGAYSPCANTNGPNNFALAAVTYVQLPAGLHRWAVRSDDGFRLAVGNAPTPTNTLIMDYEGYRGAQNPSEFYFIAPVTGVYPMRLLYYQGGFGASVEIYSIDRTTGTPILINDLTNPNSIRAFRGTSGGGSGVTLTNPQRSGNTTTFSFVTQTGRTHNVRYKNALTDPTWLLLRTITGTGSVTNISDVTAGATRFYLVETP